MSFHAGLLEGIARLLASQSMGVYRDDGVYAATDRGIVVGRFPEQPVEIVGLFLYLPGGVGLSPTATRRLAETRVQIKYRLTGHPLAGVEYFDRLHDLIDRKTLGLGDIRATGEYVSFGELGPSRQARSGYEFTTNWKLTGLAGLPLVPPAG
jgi:hypothetical protein